MENLNPDVESVVLSEEDIRGIVERMGAAISKDYAGKNPLLIAVLRGAVVFMGDLMRHIDCPLGIDFMAHQLDYALRLYNAGQIEGLIFHCTPLCDMKLEAVEWAKNWIARHADDVIGA